MTVQVFEIAHRRAKLACSVGAPAFVLVNPVEYHGPHLSLHNDHVISRGLLAALHQRLQKVHPEWELLLTSEVEMGVDPAAGPGSRHTSYATLRQTLIESCRALAELGCRRIVFITFHGAPLHNLAIDAAVMWCRTHGLSAVAPFVTILAEQLQLDVERYRGAVAHLPQPDADRLLRQLPYDFHAGFFETSVALHYAEETVDPCYLRLPPCPPIVPDAKLVFAAALAKRIGATDWARELTFAAAGVGWGNLRPYYGYASEPAFASAASGQVFASFILDSFEQAVLDVFDRELPPPRPVLRWTGPATLWGRIPAGPLPKPHEVWALTES